MTLPLFGDSAFFLDLYSRYRRDPSSVPADWRFELETMEMGQPGDTPGSAPSNAQTSALFAEHLVLAYRRFGHVEARLDPLNLSPRAASAEIAEALERMGQARLRFTLGGEEVELDCTEAAARLGALYCDSAAIEAGHVTDAESRAWLFECFEREMLAPADGAMLARTLEAVLLADEFERFVGTKFPTKKRFGMEGAEATAVIIKEVMRSAAFEGCQEVVIGGMHRGRLATLATVLNKSLPTLVAEIKGRDITGGDASFSGDVPYHNGLATTIETGAGALDVRLLPHPSHLIVVAPVAVGAARARQMARAPEGREHAVLPLLMHTDAAFSGQGLISELFQLGGLEGYRVGGTVHLVVNNQIGFTTTPQEGRSSQYPTDIGKAFGVPIFHVNGDDPISAAAVARTAVAWRNRTGRDVIIDLVCYRRNGHNELDEPRFTQPGMWAAIDAHPSLRTTYLAKVGELAPAAQAAADGGLRKFQQSLNHAFETYDSYRSNEGASETDIFKPDHNVRPLMTKTTTGVDAERLLELARAICTVPDGIDPNSKVRNFLKARLDSIEGDTGFNMATGEALAFATLLSEGTSVRLSGQDSVRGTFTQRHLMIHDRQSGRSAISLAATARDGARFEAVNSPLSEYGVLSFEYGTSLADPNRLVVWEAQFGDFLNGAQVVVDQFIVTAEAKWRIASSLVVALPHGLEGQGPDHSSARIERILQSSAGQNIIVANPSTPANLFHLLRRQQRSESRKPLFLIAPKSLLRLRNCISRLADISAGTKFEPILVRESKGACRKVVLCSGKIYYALSEALDQHKHIDDVALVLVEQLYPFPKTEMLSVLSKFAGATLVWCQEEPRNQGAWSFVRDILVEDFALQAPSFVGRPPMAAAAGGSIDRHEIEQAGIVKAALEIKTTALLAAG
jgi:2-oxoglutarate dehydrogenase E1 component